MDGSPLAGARRRVRRRSSPPPGSPRAAGRGFRAGHVRVSGERPARMLLVNSPALSPNRGAPRGPATTCRCPTPQDRRKRPPGPDRVVPNASKQLSRSEPRGRELCCVLDAEPLQSAVRAFLGGGLASGPRRSRIETHPVGQRRIAAESSSVVPNSIHVVAARTGGSFSRLSRSTPGSSTGITRNGGCAVEAAPGTAADPRKVDCGFQLLGLNGAEPPIRRTEPSLRTT